MDTVLHEVGHIDTPEAQAAVDKTIEVLQKKPAYKAQLDARLNTLKQFYDRQGVEYTEKMLLNEIAVDMRRGGLLYRTSADYDRATRTDNYNRDRFIPNTVRRATSTVKSVFGGTVTNENAGITVSAKDANTIREAWERADNASAGAHRNTNPSVSYADSSPNRGASGETAYSVETIPGTNLKYVQADRQVIKSDNPDDWEGEFYDYINNEIRNGRDVIIPTDDGDNLTISEKTAWKLGYRNEIKNSDGSSRYMTDSEYKTKLTAAGHIDELAQISKRGKKNKPDRKNHNFAKDGFNYRTGYFRDFDGRYYRLTISVGLDSENKTVYNIGKIDEVPFPAFSGSKASGKTTSAKGNSVDTSITNPDENVKTDYSVDTSEQTRYSVDTNAESEDAPPVPNEEDWENLMTGSEAENQAQRQSGRLICGMKVYRTIRNPYNNTESSSQNNRGAVTCCALRLMREFQPRRTTR